jgi:hypothetical protein
MSAFNLAKSKPENYFNSDMKSSIMGSVITAIDHRISQTKISWVSI